MVMDIGGIDTIIKSGLPPKAAAMLVLGYFYNEYPKGCHENDDLAGRREFFFYTSPEAASNWDEHGWTEKFGPEMFYVIAEKKRITIVHDREGYDFSRIESLLKL